MVKIVIIQHLFWIQILLIYNEYLFPSKENLILQWHLDKLYTCKSKSTVYPADWHFMSEKNINNVSQIIPLLFWTCILFAKNIIKSKMLWLSSIVMNGLQITFAFNILHRYKHEKNCKQYHRPSPKYSVNYL